MLGTIVPFFFVFTKGEEMKLRKRQIRLALTILILVVLLILILVSLSKLLNLLKILFLAIVTAYILTPISALLERYMARAYAIAVIITAIGLFLSLFFLFMLPSLIGEIKSIYERLPLVIGYFRKLLQGAETSLNRLGIPDGIKDSILAYTDSFQFSTMVYFKDIVNRLISGATEIPSFFISLVLAFYFLKDREYFGRVLVNIIPIKSRPSVRQVLSEINQILHRFIRGEVLIASIVGAMTTTGYLLVGLPYALVLGFVAGIFEFIPYFGPWLGAVPAIIVALVKGTKTLVWTIGTIVLIQQLEGAVIAPKILGNVVELHPAYIILTLWLGGIFFGIVGMFLAVPILLMSRVIIKHIYLAIVSIK